METISQIINWFGVIYVGIPLVCLIILIVYALFGKSVSKENADRIIEFSKWYIVSVAIVFAAKTIEAGFSERETGIKEMQVYDKYVVTILEADNIEARWKLAEYFSTVTPTERLRERWIQYKNSISEDFKKFQELQTKENELLSKNSLTPIQQESLNKVQMEKATYENKLLGNKVGRWVIVFSGDSNLESSQYELNNLIKGGIENPQIFFRDKSFRIISKIFINQKEANDYLNQHKRKIRSDAYIVDLDKWCTGEIFNGKYYECG